MSDIQKALPNPNPSGHGTPPEGEVAIDPASLVSHYEKDDVDLRGIVTFAVLIAAGAGVALLVLWLVLRYWVGVPIPAQTQIPPSLVTPAAAPGPGLDAQPELNFETLRLTQNEQLYSYGWIDRKAGIVHIPIEEAMRILVAEGVPAEDGPAPTFQLAPAFRMDSSGGVVPVGGE